MLWEITEGLNLDWEMEEVVFKQGAEMQVEVSEDNILGGGNSALEGLEMEKNRELLENFTKAFSAPGSP